MEQNIEKPLNTFAVQRLFKIFIQNNYLDKVSYLGKFVDSKVHNEWSP